MRDVKIYQSSKYRSKRFEVVNYIYYYDTIDETHCLPLAGHITKGDNLRVIVDLLCDKYWVNCKYKEYIQVGNIALGLFELRGDLEALMDASNIVNKNIKLIWKEKVPVDILVE